MQYLVQGYRSEVTVLAFSREMDAPCADAKEFALRRVDFNRFIEGLIIN